MTQEVKLKRVQCNFRSENARFLLECDFSKQYSAYYRKRLQRTRPFVEYNCRCKWSTHIPIYSLAELAGIAGVSAPGSYTDPNDTSSSRARTGSQLSNRSSPTDEPGNFRYSKRLRRLSEEASPLGCSVSQQPETSTQKSPSLFTSPHIAVPAHSPILVPSPADQSNPSQESVPARVSSDSGEEAEDRRCIVVGTIFKRMKLQPNVIKELSNGDFHIRCERYLGQYTSQDDRLVLEDDDQSICLVGNINPKEHITGIIVALLGVLVEDGSQFLVHDVCYAEPNKYILHELSIQDDEPGSDFAHNYLERPLTSSAAGQRADDDGPIYVLLVSSLGFHHDMATNGTHIGALQNMIDFVWGGNQYSDDERCSRVNRILVCGDNLSADRTSRGSPESSQRSGAKDVSIKMKESRRVKEYKESIRAIKHMDDFFAQLSKTIHVDVMPGASDPSTQLMPQQPFHPCMFPKSCVYSTFNCTTNPHHAIYNDQVELLATSGQTIDIVSKFSALSDPLEVMKCHLKWGNCAPSAPDNLYSAPYEDDDPYMIEFIPDVYVAGCQESFKTDHYEYAQYDTMESKSQSSSSSSQKATTKRKDRTLLVTLPRFSDTYSGVLLNLKNLDCELLSFI